MYLFGASGHGKVVAEIAEKNGVPIDGFIDADCNKKSLLGYNVLQEDAVSTDVELTVSIGNNLIRKEIVEKHSTFKYKSLIHSASNISKRAQIGEGTVIMAGVSINSDVKIGQHCIVNTNTSIDHDCVIDNFVHISPNVGLAGDVHVGEGTHVGIGTNVIQGIKIGKWSTIGAGAVIIHDVPDGATVVGNPGRVIKAR